MKWIISLFACLLSLPVTAADVKVEGAVLSVTRSEEHIYLTGEAGHRNQYRTEFDVKLEAPKEYAGLCYRFGLYTDGPVSYADWKGKKVVVTLSGLEPIGLVFFPQAIALKTEANQALVPTPMSVTPAASAPVAPATGAAHL